jgi:hypothetical protein
MYDVDMLAGLTNASARPLVLGGEAAQVRVGGGGG